MSAVTFWSDWFWKALWSMPEFLGGNWIGAIFAFACAFFYERRKFLAWEKFRNAPTQHAKIRVLGSFLMDHWKDTVRLWLCIFIVFLIGNALDLVYRNANSLSVRNAELSTTIYTNNSACEKDKSELRISSAAERSRADTLSTQNRDQQSSINNCQTQAIKLLTPEPWKMTVRYLSGRELPTQQRTQRGAQLLLLTNKPISPVRLSMRCDQPFNVGFMGGVLVVDALPQSGGAFMTSQDEAEIQVQSPPWTPDYPLLVSLSYFGNKEIECNFARK